jgi:hypothetical protein
MACIGCGLDLLGDGTGRVDLDPVGGLQCNGVAGSGTPTINRGLRVFVAGDAVTDCGGFAAHDAAIDTCTALHRECDGAIWAERASHFQTFVETDTGGSLTAGNTAGPITITYDNTNGCDDLAIMAALEFQFTSAGAFTGTLQVDLNGGGYAVIYTLSYPAMSTTVQGAPRPLIITQGTSYTESLKYVSATGTLTSWGLAITAWGDYV